MGYILVILQKDQILTVKGSAVAEATALLSLDLGAMPLYLMREPELITCFSTAIVRASLPLLDLQ